MQIIIVILGLMSLLSWGFIFYRASLCPLGWYSPTGLVSLGFIVFYIVPPLYFQFRPWDFFVPDYFEGIPITYIAVLLFSFPFLIVAIHGAWRRKGKSFLFYRNDNYFGGNLWVFLIPLLFGVGRKLYLFSIGHQSRFERISSDTQEGLIDIFSLYYPLCYFALFAFGNKMQRRIGISFWILDGFLQLYSLHRYYMLLFVLHSLIFAQLLGWKMSKKHWLTIGMFVVFVVVVIGKTFYYGLDIIKASDKMSLSVGDLAVVISQSTEGFFKGEFSSIPMVGEDQNFLLKAFDETFFRIYEARSESGIISAVSNGDIPFLHGETFKHIPWALLPKAFFPSKPELARIHEITKVVMTDPNEQGTLPCGTIAELYMNFGLFSVFIGGVVCLLIVYLHRKSLFNNYHIRPAWLIVYPFTVEWYLGANAAYTQRINAGFRLLLIYVVMTITLRFIEKKRKIIPQAQTKG